MRRIRRKVLPAIGVLRREASIWVCLGVLVWVFLPMPYALSTVDCVRDIKTETIFECLKPVAQELREDSILAMYATATVAAIIAWRLRQRNPDHSPNDQGQNPNNPEP